MKITITNVLNCRLGFQNQVLLINETNAILDIPLITQGIKGFIRDY